MVKCPLELGPSKLDSLQHNAPATNESREQFQQLVQVRLESEAHEKSDNCRGLSLLGQKCLLRQFHYRKDHGGRMYINRPMCARHACGQRGTWNDNARTVSSCAASLSSLLTPWDLRCSVAVAAEPIKVRLCCCCCC